MHTGMICWPGPEWQTSELVDEMGKHFLKLFPVCAVGLDALEDILVRV